MCAKTARERRGLKGGFAAVTGGAASVPESASRAAGVRLYRRRGLGIRRTSPRAISLASAEGLFRWHPGRFNFERLRVGNITLFGTSPRKTDGEASVETT